MHNIAEFWEAGGPWMYPIALMGAVALVATLALGVVAAVARDEAGSRTTLVLSSTLVALGLATLLLGIVGWLMCMRNVELAIATVNPDDMEAIRAAGNAEARSPLILSVLLAFLPLCGGVALMGLGVSRLPRFTQLSGVTRS
jgi:hypothetical protein